jgi:hypothetical protein
MQGQFIRNSGETKMNTNEESMDIEQKLEPLAFSTFDLSRMQVGTSGQTVRWIQYNDNEPIVYAKTMMALDSDEITANSLAGSVAVQDLLPMPVHHSPLLLMLSRCNHQDAYKQRFVSSLSSALQLRKILLYYTTIHVQLAVQNTASGVAESESERVDTIYREYARRLEMTIEQLHAFLYPLYRRLSFFCVF